MNFLRSLWLSAFVLLSVLTPAVAQVACPSNIDFELGTLTGWNCYTSTNNGTGVYTWSFTAPINNRHKIVSGAATDPYGGFPIVAPAGGTYSLKLGNDNNGAQMEQVRYTFTVPIGQNEYAVIYRYAVVLEDPNHHPNEQPFFEVKAYNTNTGATVNCGNFSYVSSASLPGFVYNSSYQLYYKDWATASLNLSGQAGNTITLEFTTADCSLTGHFGYAYVDMNCGLFAIQNTACAGYATAPLSAPPGFQSYTWYDAGFNIVGTGQNITVPNPTQQTLYRVKLVPYPGYGCTDTLSSIVVPAVLNIDAGKDTILCNIPSVSLPVTVNGSAPPFNYTWTANTGTSSLSCTNCSTPTATPAALTSYYLTVTDNHGCIAQDTVSVLPTVSLQAPTIVPVSCFGNRDGSVSIIAENGTAPLNFLWATPSAQTSTSISGLAAGSYNLTITDGRGCITQPAAFVVPQPAVLDASISAQQNISCNGGSNGSATVTATGGTMPYTYGWNTTPAQITATATNLLPGTYTVTITDAKGCVDTAMVTITQPATALSVTATQTASFCNGVDNGTATVTASGGTMPYAYAWNSTPAQTTATATNLAGGIYTATVTDANGCVDTIPATINQIAALNVSVAQTDVSCNGGNNGTAIVTVSGGTNPYAYSWNTTPTQATDTAKNLTAGNYTVTVTDSNGCISSQSVSITEPAALQLSSVQTDVLCNGDTNGTATVTATGGTMTYAYSWSDGQTTDTAKSLSAGSYTATVTDAKGCVDSLSISINEPAALSLSTAQTDVFCNGGNNGTATVTATGGTASYTYSWNTTPAQTNATASNLTVGTYRVTVTDANSCAQSVDVIITEPTALTATATGTDVSCNGGNNGTATIIAAGGTTPYAYSWSDGQTTDTAQNLTAGTYTATVTDGNGCTQIATVMLSQPTAITVSTAQTDVSCNGGNNGTATVTATGGTAPYTYSWSDGQTTDTAKNLTAGTYTATVTDSNGCIQTATVTITEPTMLSLSTTQTDVSCNSVDNGTATVNASGGTSPYTYSWNTTPAQTTAAISALATGAYTATVTDANGCIQTTAVMITEPVVLTATTTQTDVSCNGGIDGTATVIASGGTAPYSYSWSNGQTTTTTSGLSAGSYTVTVTDANGCTQTTTATIAEPAALVASATGTDVSCNGGNNGTATVAATGGTSPYTYSWSDGQITDTATGLTAGTYTATVTDNNGCTQTTIATIAEPTLLSLSTTQTDVSCNGGNSGTALVTATGGTAPYTYNWSDGQTTDTAKNLTAGTYTATVTDGNGCIQTTTVTITEPTDLTASTTQTDVSCNGGTNGTITVTATGGTSPYAYSWSDGQTTATAIGLTAGTYTATVTDTKGCIQTATTTITEPTLLSLSTTQTDVSCNGGTDGTATVTASGGTTPYAYSWSTTPAQTNATAIGLSARSYAVLVTDANGCTQAATAAITQPATLTATATQTDVSCNGGNNGTATVTASGGTSPYTYSWNTTPVQNTANAGGLLAGSYTATITDANGCVETVSVSITEPTVLTASTMQTDVSCNGGSNGTATVIVSGGTAPYSYSWNTTPVQTSMFINNLTAGGYQVTVTDTNGCIQPILVTITEPSLLILSTNQTNVFCNGGNSGTASVTASGGTAPYSHSWSTTPVQTTASISTLFAGTYVDTVADANGCTQIAQVIITQPAALIVTATGTDASCNGGTDGTATVAATGRTAPYTYSWSDGQTAATAIGLTAGTYTATVTDANGCIQTATTTITEPMLLSLSATQTGVSCNGGSDGTAAVTASGGTGPYSYSWNTTPAQTTASISTLTAGSYTATVTDANGCAQTAMATITEPAVLSATTTQTNVSCNGGNNGTATATATGGTLPYTYSWNTIPAQTTAGISNLSVGSYTATITDANGCTQSATAAITEPAVLTVSAAGTDVSCFGSNNGTATVTASGGTAPYSYSWNTTPVQATATASGLIARAYTATVTDANGCIQTATTTITEPTLLSLSTTQTNASCNSGNNGTATVTASGGTAPYSYSWNTTPIQTSTTANNLAAGIYTVTVTDANSCTKTATTTIVQPTAIGLSTTQTNVSCNGGTNGAAIVTASGGTAPYSYSWNTTPAQTTPTANNLAAGSYTATVTDNNSCSQTTIVTITQPAALTATTTQTNISCNGGTNGTATVTAGGSAAPYSYSWNTIPTRTTAGISNLAAGSYTATVTDANGCTQTATTSIIQPTVLTAAISRTDASCSNSTDGTATVTASGGTAPYTYSWNTTPSQTTATATTLPSGSYTVTVTDANGCAKTATIAVSAPSAIALSFAHTDVLCAGGTNGTATITASGGTAPYTHSWNTAPAQTTTTASNLAAGSYTLTTTDANGCIQTGTATIAQPAVLTATGSQTNPSCNGGTNGTATLTAGGGTAPYSYSWNTIPTRTTAGISNLAAGSYTATVTDANGCTKTTTVTIAQPAALTATAVGNNSSCYGFTNGAATVAMNGGTAPYTYSWNTTPVQTTQTATNLAIGNYTVAATDARGCTAMATVTLTQPDSLSLAMTARDVRCFNGTDGFASVVTTGGTAPYTYEWNGNATLNTASYNAFSAGAQLVRVTDAKGCVKTATAIINNPTLVVAALVVDSIPCYGAATGVIRVASVSGGTGPYEYYWQGSSSPGTSTLQNLPAGSYTVRIIDQPGCVNNFTITMPEHPSQNLSAGKDSLVCAGSTMTMQATGSAVQWQWTPAAYLSCNNCQNPVATPLQTTTYLLTGTDSFGCVAMDSVTLTVQQHQPVSAGDSIRLCVGKEATLSATGGDRYLWTPSTGLSCTDCPNPVVSDTVTNNYQVVISQGDCFTDTLYQSVVIAPNPTIAVSSDVLLFSGAQITLQTTTSANTKSIYWTPAVGLNCYNCRTPTVVDGRTTTYVATAVTEYGCMTSDSVRVTVACDGSPFYVANTFTPNGDGRDDWFYPQGTGLVRINRMLIQSRWGEIIFERNSFSSNEPEMGWNGTYRGQPMSSGTFMYLIEALCDSGEQMILKGDINLIR